MDCIRDVLDCDCELGRTLFTKAAIDLCIIQITKTLIIDIW